MSFFLLYLSVKTVDTDLLGFSKRNSYNFSAFKSVTFHFY